MSVSLVAGSVAYSDFSTTLRELYPSLARASASASGGGVQCGDDRIVSDPGWALCTALTKYLAVIWILYTLSWLIAPPALRKPDIENLGDFLSIGAVMAFFGTVIIAQILRRRRTRDSIQRQQTKWVFYGLLGFFIIMNSAWAPMMIVPALRNPGVSSLLWEFLLIQHLSPL